MLSFPIIDNDEGQIKFESHYHIIKKLNYHSDVKENYYSDDDEPNVKKMKMGNNIQLKESIIDKNTIIEEKSNRNMINVTDKPQQQCNRCPRIAVFECKNEECSQLLRKYLCEFCDRNIHRGITTSDHERVSVTSVTHVKPVIPVTSVTPVTSVIPVTNVKPVIPVTSVIPVTPVTSVTHVKPPVISVKPVTSVTSTMPVTSDSKLSKGKEEHYKCDRCLKNFPTEIHLKDHNFEIHSTNFNISKKNIEKNLVQCPICKKIGAGLENHLKLEHQIREIQPLTTMFMKEKSMVLEGKKCEFCQEFYVQSEETHMLTCKSNNVLEYITG